MFAHIPNLLSQIPRQTLQVAGIILAQKIVLTLLLFLAPVCFPSCFKAPGLIEQRFRAFDTDYYLRIAASGYGSKDNDEAFYPLWPLCIRVGSILLNGNALLSAYVLANLFSLGGLLLFHRVVSERQCESVATKATVLLLLYPGSIFFFFPYSESLFLLLLMLCLYCLQRGNYAGVALAAFLIPMARAIGVFILPILLWELIRKKSPARNYAVCATPLLGYLCYFGLMYSYAGDPLAGFAAQLHFPAAPSVARIFDPMGFIESFTTFSWSHDMRYSIIDRGLFVVFLASLFWVIRMDSTYYVYAVFTGLVPALSNVLMSYTRFLSLVFPLFVVAAQLTFRTWLFGVFVTGSATAQVYFFLRHLSRQWVG